MLFYIGNNVGNRGVEFFIKRKWESKIQEFEGINDRMAKIKNGLGKFGKIKKKTLY